MGGEKKGLNPIQSYYTFFTLFVFIFSRNKIGREKARKGQFFKTKDSDYLSSVNIAQQANVKFKLTENNILVCT